MTQEKQIVNMTILVPKGDAQVFRDIEDAGAEIVWGYEVSRRDARLYDHLLEPMGFTSAQVTQE